MPITGGCRVQIQTTNVAEAKFHLLITGVLRVHLVIIRTRPDVPRARRNDLSNHTSMALVFFNFST